MIQARRILVPVNGNPTDDDMISLACGLAKRQRGEVIAMYVIEVKRTLPLDADLPPEASKGEQALERAEETAEELGVDLKTELLQARDVGTAIVDEAVARQADLIILGMPYRKKFGEFDLGKTAPYVLKHAPCSVWIAREPMQ
jgi:nucleotide-binding universal stress UspA family protein